MSGALITMVLMISPALAAGCTGDTPGSSRRASSSPSASQPTVSDLPAEPAARAAALVARLADEDLIGQVLMPYAYGDDATKVSAASARANRKYAGVATPAEMIAKYRLGGVILMGWSADDPTAATTKTSNVDSPEQIHRLTTGLQAAGRALPAQAPLLIATDQEYGVVTRIRQGVVQLPSAMALGAASNPALTERAWQAAGTELAALGINVDFAPDADVVGDRPGGVIGSRSFGSDPQAVGAQVAAAVRGLQSAGVAAALKHFPGHGHTTVDSHTELPVLGQDQAKLDREDLPPFTMGRDAGAHLIMSGHLDVRAIDPGMPATFSAKVLTDLLRNRLAYPGVVVSDALNMEPAKRWPTGEAAVRALVAGNDLLLMPPDLAAAHQGLTAGLRSGALPRARLVEAATRVLTVKYKLGLTPQPPMSVVGGEAHRAAAAAAAAAAITVLRGPCNRPLVTGPVRVTAADKWDQQRRWLEEALRTQGLIVGDTGAEIRLVGYQGTADALSVGAAVTVAMDTPHILGSVKSGALVASYSGAQVAMQAVAAVLAGKAKAPGRSPVAVQGLPRSAC